jgi:DNA polymerase III subunit beta
MQMLQSNLKNGLDVVGGAIPRSPSLPVLSHVLIAAENGAIRLAGTDLETFIRCRVNGKAEHNGKGAYTLPYRLFNDLVKSLPKDVVTMETDGNTVAVSCGHTDARVNSIDGDEFPRWDKQVYELGTTVKADPVTLTEALKAVAYATATDESRPILTGVMFRFETGKVTFAAADGFRLAVSEMLVDDLELDEPWSVVVSGEAVEHLLRLMSSETEPIAICVDGTDEDAHMAYFRLDGSQAAEDGIFDVEMASTLIQGQFVSYERIIPESHVINVVVSREAMITALRRAEIFARYEAHVVHLYIEPDEGKIVMKADSAEMGEHQGEVEARIDGERLHIALNTTYLRQAVSAMPTDDVTLGFNGNMKPVTVRPVSDVKLPLAVIMPMHVTDPEDDVDVENKTEDEAETEE